MILLTEVVMATPRKEDEGVAAYFPLSLTNTFKCQSDKVQAEDNSGRIPISLLTSYEKSQKPGPLAG